MRDASAAGRGAATPDRAPSLVDVDFGPGPTPGPTPGTTPARSGADGGATLLGAGAPAREGLDNLLPARLHDLLRASVRAIWARRRAIEREQRAIRDIYDAARAQGLRPATVKHVMAMLELPAEALDEKQQREAERAAYWSVVEDLRSELGAAAAGADAGG